MDAVEFYNTRKRMCRAYKAIRTECPIHKIGSGRCSEWCAKHPEEAVAAVEQWAKEHPVKTRQSEFLEHYPDARIDQNTGALDICPNKIFDSATGINCNVQPCFECEKKFWLAEAET